ncbi:ketoacyl-ACP synthase III [Hwanghaeella grinnelliae]|uniref:Beta-ketoacyl-[acyl-carrier-protein] synthase III n=1 Tax=Hwanghaeella grinnelliae TaxID=2500179 RepID=A0A437QYQ3_9PROT|nr:beta-ketoacyl-ACP synthase III [Hwanghaeella grinnelliae]RVU39621.1 ketoacyl-ACP synthase III [Hwanghaeella grinnelliae]
MSIVRSQVVGVGSYLPERVLTNDDLAKTVDTSDAWIVKRTGIKQRHIAADGELTSDLGREAALRAMSAAQVKPQDVDLIVLATTTPDNTFPATAARIQSQLGVTKGPAFDVQAVCSGFVFGLAMADNMLRLGQATTALVIGAEIYSRILDWNDRGTCVLFGDGAGAAVLRAVDGAGSNADRGILSTHIYTDGTRYDQLYVDGGPATNASSGHVRMQGQEVFRFAVNSMASSVRTGLEANGLTLKDINWLIPHQANSRIIAKVGETLDVPDEKVIVTVQNHANTSAATIPLALTHGFERQLFKPGDLLALTAMGGGFSWGSAILRW